MKARDIRAALNGNADPKVILALCSIAESLSAQQEEINAMAEILDGLTNILTQLTGTMEQTTKAVDKIKGIRGEE